jgi:glycosyltransferase involved in cell wall biosynthesis
MPASLPALVVVGAPRHGVAEYALDLASAVRRIEPGIVIERFDTAVEAEAALAGHERVHLHVTDGLFGATLEEAGARVDALAGVTRVSMTFHDVPQASDGERNLPRRARAYRQMASRATGVAVSSHHEAALLAEHGVVEGVAVVPLGTRVSEAPAGVPPAVDPGGRARILIAGYLYPGKGHDDVIRAAALAGSRLGETIDVLALGGVSGGHDALAGELSALADDLGVRFSATGYLDDAAYRSLQEGPGVPVVAHQHYSASRSLLDWAERGRRPVVVETRYTDEMAVLRPGTLRLAAPSGSALADALVEGLQDPALTLLASGHPLEPTLADSARAYLHWWRELAW